MKLTKKELNRIAKEQGFVRDTLEKVYRLEDILVFMNSHPLMKKRLALKGGTAINLTVFNLPRLSVDIDLDYSVDIDREGMLEERKIIAQDLEKYMQSQRYEKGSKSKSRYSLESYIYVYTNAAGVRDNIKIEINYSMRLHVLPLVHRDVITNGILEKNSVLAVAGTELFGSKIKALLDRAAARDLYDVSNMIKFGLFDSGEMDLLRKCTVSGIYSDITSGGRTAQAIFATQSGDILSVSIPVTFLTGVDAEAILAGYKEQFPFAKVYGIEENIDQMFGSVINAIKMASYAAIGVTVLLTILVTVLFMKMLVAKDRYPIAILKSLGFTSADISGQYLARSVIVLALGVIIGTVLANTLGEYVGVAIVSVFGATAFNFVVNPFFAYLVSPLLIAACVYIATLLGVSDIRPLKISEHIKEA